MAGITGPVIAQEKIELGEGFRKKSVHQAPRMPYLSRA
jgi:hypothetical protein